VSCPVCRQIFALWICQHMVVQVLPLASTGLPHTIEGAVYAKAWQNACCTALLKTLATSA
jgi:hypothetical protein